MKKVCECGKELDERINYCVHCGKELEKKTTSANTTKKKNSKSGKYSPLLEIFKG
mgnify:CR=1 FL=1